MIASSTPASEPTLITALIAGLLGLAIGILVTALVARLVHDRLVQRARDAERRARSAERLAELGAMTAGLAHEIKNPLSTVGLNAQLLTEGIEEQEFDPDEKRRLLNRVTALRRETERLRGILTDFLQFAGELRVTTAPGDLNALADDLIDFFNPQAQAARINLRSDLHPGAVPVEIDAPHTKQAVLNLMLNAVQAMSEQSEDRPRDLIVRTRVTTAASGRVAELHVIDTGPGFDESTRSRIFEPYYTTRRGGSGLGLPTSRRLIEAQNGQLEVVSEPGQGSDFVVRFPLAPSQSGEAAQRD